MANISGEYGEIFNTVTEVIDICSSINTKDLTITIPFNLYYLSSGYENGYEHVLEGEEIVINATSRNDDDIIRSRGFLKIVLSENACSIIEINKKLNEKDISQFSQDEKTLCLDYRIARKIIFDLISYLEPASLNLITK